MAKIVSYEPTWGRSFAGCVCNPTNTSWGMGSELEPEPQIQALLLMGNFSSLVFPFLNKTKFRSRKICRTRLFFMFSPLSNSPQALLTSEGTEHSGLGKASGTHRTGLWDLFTGEDPGMRNPSLLSNVSRWTGKYKGRNSIPSLEDKICIGAAPGAITALAMPLLSKANLRQSWTKMTLMKIWNKFLRWSYIMNLSLSSPSWKKLPQWHCAINWHCSSQRAQSQQQK